MNTVDQKEIQNFSKDSAHWWDENGPFKPLHRLNPVRLAYLKDQICAHFDRDAMALNSYKGLDILDIGCGGGLVCEPMARLGAKTTGIDADENAISVAKEHAEQSNLKITYKAVPAEQLLKNKKRYDVVLALEIIEHVSNPEEFVQTVLELCKPEGLVIFSTLNRTPKSYALGIVAAEYILRWVPTGTHNWKKFIKPAELSRFVRKSGGAPQNVCGLVFNPLNNTFSLNQNDVSVNYFLSCRRSK